MISLALLRAAGWRTRAAEELRLAVEDAALNDSDAFIAAWLPGAEGLGVTDVLFGDHKPTGKLPRTWPADTAASSAQSGFSFGYGLTYSKPPQTAGRIKTASAN